MIVNQIFIMRLDPGNVNLTFPLQAWEYIKKSDIYVYIYRLQETENSHYFLYFQKLINVKHVDPGKLALHFKLLVYYNC